MLKYIVATRMALLLAALKKMEKNRKKLMRAKLCKYSKSCYSVNNMIMKKKTYSIVPTIKKISLSLILFIKQGKSRLISFDNFFIFFVWLKSNLIIAYLQAITKYEILGKTNEIIVLPTSLISRTIPTYFDMLIILFLRL